MKTKLKPILILLFCQILTVSAVACQQCPSNRSERYCEIRRSIKKNLHIGAHLQLAVTGKTCDDVKKEVKDEDIPVLIELLGDNDDFVRIGAAGVLERFEEKALLALKEAAKSENWNLKMAAEEAIRNIDARLQAKKEGR